MRQEARPRRPAAAMLCLKGLCSRGGGERWGGSVLGPRLSAPHPQRPAPSRGGARPGVGSVRGGPAGRRRLGWEQRGEPRAAVRELRAGPGAAGGCAGSEPAAGVWTSPPGCALGPGGPRRFGNNAFAALLRRWCNCAPRGSPAGAGERRTAGRLGGERGRRSARLCAQPCWQPEAGIPPELGQRPRRLRERGEAVRSHGENPRLCCAVLRTGASVVSVKQSENERFPAAPAPRSAGTEGLPVTPSRVRPLLRSRRQRSRGSSLQLHRPGLRGWDGGSGGEAGAVCWLGSRGSLEMGAQGLVCVWRFLRSQQSAQRNASGACLHLLPSPCRSVVGC
ncbi:translation initiation factor IF-2-like isoform X2 [Gallus gallus]|uniref:translation initiation factor IF-2-like isoform X2 n=1 Tax=Gallus gallus TaxID=9031 RepID=UPI000739E9DB|nr:translation initiation factor IF-2-like isoform X2 [Gallus gallus]|eukprot:XP_015138915.1 uncharacterized protein LOC107052855 [Gallus gallus]